MCVASGWLVAVADRVTVATWGAVVGVAEGVAVGLGVGEATGVRVGDGVTLTSAGVIDGGGTSRASCVAWHAAAVVAMVATRAQSAIVASLEFILGVAFRWKQVRFEARVRVLVRAGEVATYPS